MGLILAADSDVPGAVRGFYIARAHPDGYVEDRTNTDTPDVFDHDYSFRDYFHGTGNRQNEEGQPHSVVRTTHISDPYRARGDDRTTDGQRIHRPWKVDIVTPIWDAPPPDNRRVVGLLVFGMNLERDIVTLLEPADLGAKGNAQLGIARRVKVVLIDDRTHWVWHPDCRGGLAEDRPDLRLPHSYRALAAARGLDPEQALPWLRIGAPEPGHKFGYIEAYKYVDLVEDEREDSERNSDPEIACFTRFSPYAAEQVPGSAGAPVGVRRAGGPQDRARSARRPAGTDRSRRRGGRYRSRADHSGVVGRTGVGPPPTGVRFSWLTWKRSPGSTRPPPARGRA